MELIDLTDAEFASVSSMLTPAVREVLTVQGALAARATVNGTAPVRVAEQLAGLRRQLDRLALEFPASS